MAQPQLRIACSLAAEKEMPGWPKALESAASEAALEHQRQWWGAKWPGVFLWGAEPPRAPGARLEEVQAQVPS